MPSGTAETDLDDDDEGPVRRRSGSTIVAAMFDAFAITQEIVDDYEMRRKQLRCLIHIGKGAHGPRPKDCPICALVLCRRLKLKGAPA
jgi:hypothetical protein